MPAARSSSTDNTCSRQPTRRRSPSSGAPSRQLRAGPRSRVGTDFRVAVIGVGHLGKHHARILSALDGASLVAVVDKIPERAAEIAAASRTRSATSAAEILDQVDAVTIAVPTELHRDIALPFLERGISVLVEKPMAR